MKSRNRTLYLVVVVVLFFLLIIWGYRNLAKNQDPSQNFPESSQKGKVKENEEQKIKDFKVYNSKNEEVTFKEITNGKPAVINFWASWCTVCETEMPDFESAYKEHKDDIEFIMINLTDGKRETEKTAIDSINKNNFSFPIYYDKDLAVSNEYKIYSIPTTFFVDSKGTIKEIHQGLLSKDTLEEILKDLK